MFGTKNYVRAMILVLALCVVFLFPPCTFPQDESSDEESKTKELFQMSLEDLMNVKITTAGKTEEKISEIPASVVVITREDIEKYGYKNVVEILENIPGLYFINDYLLQNFGLRGYYSGEANRNIIILVNNIPQTDYMSSSNFIQQLNVPTEAIDRIEVVRGPMSVIYGTGAFYGVINIFTNKMEHDFDNLVAVSVGSDKTKKLVMRSSGQEGEFSYVFNAAYSNSDGINAPYNEMVSDPSILPILGLSEEHTTKGQLQDEQKYFNFSGTFNNFHFDASYSESHHEGMLILPPVGDGTVLTNKLTRLNIKHSQQFSETLKLVTKFCYFLNRMTFRYDMLQDEFYGNQNNQSSGYNFELNLFYNPSEKLNLLFGLEYKKVMDAVSEYNFPVWGLNNIHKNLVDGETLITQSLFFQLNYRFSDRLKIVAGARVEHTPEWTWQWVVGSTEPARPTYTTEPRTYSYTRAEFIPRIALIYSIDDDNYLKFLYGKAINRPSFFQQAANLNMNISLEPEMLNTIEINYIGNLSSRLSLSLSLFRNTLDQLILRSMFVNSAGDIVSRFGNVGKFVTNGVELTLNTKPFENFHMELSGTYQDTKDKRDGFEHIEPGYSPNFLAYLKGSYFFNENTSLAVTGSFVDEMETHFDETLPTPARIGERVSSYFILGANVRLRRLFNTDLFLNLNGSNLLDKKIYYPTTSNNQNFIYKGTIGRGLSFLLTLGYKF